MPFTFPDPNLSDDEGLVAIGGDLHPDRLFSAYQQGIFPWFNPGEPILWWSPNPRMVLNPEQLKVSKSLKKTIDKQSFEIRWNSAFEEVMRACKNTPRKDQDGTWISEDMIEAYCSMFSRGNAFSVEAWQNEKLVGGLYGITIDRMVFGESMFSHVSDASKVCLYYLCQACKRYGIPLIDCQVETPHLMRLGAQLIPRTEFLSHLKTYCKSKQSDLSL